MIKVVFVCHGNICRSPMAEYVFKDIVEKRGVKDSFYIESRATSTEEIGNRIYPYARDELIKHNIKGYESHRATQFTISDYKAFDYILVMDDNNLYNLKRIIGIDVDNKVYRLLDFTTNKGEIEDPWYTGNFDKVFNQIDNGCKCFLEYLKETNKV
ncbi:MAG: low molecular weight phosphotyrosine protein phosphatase [Clostridia bacterium]|nr:low molecular weight phosphotyrosine protein phosphatase [Clostridia bacterium]